MLKLPKNTLTLRLQSAHLYSYMGIFLPLRNIALIELYISRGVGLYSRKKELNQLRLSSFFPSVYVSRLLFEGCHASWEERVRYDLAGLTASGIRAWTEVGKITRSDTGLTLSTARITSHDGVINQPPDIVVER